MHAVDVVSVLHTVGVPEHVDVEVSYEHPADRQSA
jgi:hypothetical protein